jgi:hypothetical protein
MSRSRNERVVASLLRDRNAPLRLPRVIRAGLRFGDREPLDSVLESLARFGLDDPERLRDWQVIPGRPLLLRVCPNAPWGVPVAGSSDLEILHEALLLGLCTAFQYDPERPVLWTRASLTRRVELYDPEGFYA